MRSEHMSENRESGRKPVRVAIIGAGGYGGRHVEMVEQLSRAGEVRFVAVADPTGDRLGELKSRLEGEGVEWFSDYRVMLETWDGRLDVVVISTPIPLHLPMLEAALDRNLFVLLEKPPVPLIQDYRRVAARPEAGRVALGFNLLADPDLWRLKRAILSGRLGKIRSLRAGACWPRFDAYYHRAGWAGRMIWNGLPVFDGPATNALAHIVHNIMFLAGAKETAFGVPNAVRGELYRARPIESYDVSGLTGTFPNGVTFSAAFAHAVEETLDWEIVVEGEDGSAVLGPKGVRGDIDAEPSGRSPSLMEGTWTDFLAFVTGRKVRPFTALSDCLGYVAATNGMLVSSGGVRALPPSVVRKFGEGDAAGYAVEGMADLVRRTIATGASFAACGASWAADGSWIELSGLDAVDPARFVGETG